MHEIFGTICLAGAIQALFLFVVLVVKKNNRRANRYLSLYLLFGALDAFELYLGSRGYITAVQPYQISIIPYSLIFGPSVYLYTASLTGRINPPAGKHLLLYAPFLTALGVNIISFIIFRTSQLPGSVIYINTIINGGGLFFEAVLYGLSFVMLYDYMKRLKEYFSDIDALKLSSLRWVLVILLLSLVFIFIPYAGGHMRYEREIFDVIAILGGLGLVFALGFLAVMQPEIFNRVRLMENTVTPAEEVSTPKYEKLRLPLSKEKEYVQKLKDFMREEKPWLQEDLTLQDLADDLSLPACHLTMILNIHFKQNFYNFINSYRVEDVKGKLTGGAYKDENILSIAFSAGFNSKTTFNAMFKKFTGKTPKEYRNGN